MSSPCTLSRRRGSRVASAAAPFAGARGYEIIQYRFDRHYFLAYLGRDVIVEMTCIVRRTKHWLVRRRIFVYIIPINAPEPRVCLAHQRKIRHLPDRDYETQKTDFYQMRAIHAARSTIRGNKAASPGLNDHGVWPANRRRGLRAEAVLRLA